MRSSAASHTRLLPLLILLIALPGAIAQLAPVRMAPLNGHLETYDNPPAPPRKIETSPRMLSVYGAFISYQVNVDQNGQNILGDAANECSISVDPTNGSKMTIAWRQFNDVTSNFRQGGWGYTTDAGVHWTFPGVLQNNVFRSDPVTQSDEAGQFFYLSLQSTWPKQTFYCDDLWRSTNGGQTWTEQSPDRSAGGDKEWLTIDKTSGPGHGFQYQIYDGANCARHQRGISTLHKRRRHLAKSSVTLPNSPIYGTLDVDTNGNVFVGGWTGGTGFRCRALEQRTDRRPDTLF